MREIVINAERMMGWCERPRPRPNLARGLVLVLALMLAGCGGDGRDEQRSERRPVERERERAELAIHRIDGLSGSVDSGLYLLAPRPGGGLLGAGSLLGASRGGFVVDLNAAGAIHHWEGEAQHPQALTVDGEGRALVVASRSARDTAYFSVQRISLNDGGSAIPLVTLQLSGSATSAAATPTRAAVAAKRNPMGVQLRLLPLGDDSTGAHSVDLPAALDADLLARDGRLYAALLYADHVEIARIEGSGTLTPLLRGPAPPSIHHLSGLAVQGGRVALAGTSAIVEKAKTTLRVHLWHGSVTGSELSLLTPELGDDFAVTGIAFRTDDELALSGRQVRSKGSMGFRYDTLLPRVNLETGELIRGMRFSDDTRFSCLLSRGEGMLAAAGTRSFDGTSRAVWFELRY